jgi:hypothetical protein
MRPYPEETLGKRLSPRRRLVGYRHLYSAAYAYEEVMSETVLPLLFGLLGNAEDMGAKKRARTNLALFF